MTWLELIVIMVLLPPLSALVATAITRDWACFRFGVVFAYKLVLGSCLAALILAGVQELI